MMTVNRTAGRSTVTVAETRTLFGHLAQLKNLKNNFFMQTISVILYYTATEQTIQQCSYSVRVLSHDSKRVFVNSSVYAVVNLN